VNSLRVIVVTPEPPDPFGNAAARWYYALAKGLVGNGHSITYLSVRPRGLSDSSLQRARQAFKELAVPLTLYESPKLPWLKKKFRTIAAPFSHFISDQLRRDVDKAMGDGYDVLNLEQMWTGYLAHGAERAVLSVHHLELLDLRGVTRPSLRFLVSKYQMFRAERSILKSLSFIRVTTDRLAAHVMRINPAAHVPTVPVALDPSLYTFAQGGQESQTIGLIASLGWQPGYDAAVRLITRIWPRVKQRVPSSKLLIAGWGARHALASYTSLPDVEIVENVPETESYFRRLRVLVYPLTQGSGMKIKLLEAMAYGVPIVTTSEGGEGLSLQDGNEGFITNDDDLIAERVVQLLSNSVLCSNISRSARDLIEREYSPLPAAARMERVYCDVIKGGG
jgi:polysaccharide biosynthesis protein PslH